MFNARANFDQRPLRRRRSSGDSLRSRPINSAARPSGLLAPISGRGDTCTERMPAPGCPIPDRPVNTAASPMTQSESKPRRRGLLPTALAGVLEISIAESRTAACLCLADSRVHGCAANGIIADYLRQTRCLVKPKPQSHLALSKELGMTELVPPGKSFALRHPSGNARRTSMASGTHQPRRRLRAREIRMLFYLLVLLGVVAWKFVPRPWHPAFTFEAPHHLIYSSASRAQTADTAQTLELLYIAYSNRFGSLDGFQRHRPSSRSNSSKIGPRSAESIPGLGWAEAFYRTPYCLAYYSANEINPYHWMLHESVHQLNQEVAHLALGEVAGGRISRVFLDESVYLESARARKN